MAEQSGIIRLKGTLGGISFYKSGDGYLAREKGGVSASRIANDPAFQRTRENGAEFGRAGSSGKLLRNALQVLLQKAKDRRTVGRLTKSMLAVIKTDTVNARGLRTVPDGDMNLLKRFEFNINGKLDSTFFMPLQTNIDRTAGQITLDIEAYQPTIRLVAPAGTSHYRLSLGGAELDFEQRNFVFGQEQTAIMPYDSTEIPTATLTADLTANSTFPIVAVVGVEFFQEVSSEMYPLKNGTFNCLAITSIDNNG